MKICVLGLDCAAPEIIFHDERLTNIRRLMETGIYGRLQTVIPPITVPAWMCMATSQDPGSLGIYGFRNRSDYSYDKLRLVNSASIKELTIWDQLAHEGKRSILVGVPPSYPPRRINGISVGCFLTPDTVNADFTNPPAIKNRITELVGEYPVDVKGFRTDRKEWIREQVFEMSRKQWQVVRCLMAEHEWDYFQFVDIGLDRIHHGFWEHFDPKHRKYIPGNPYEEVIPQYYRWLDEQIGSTLELLDNDTIVLLVSDHGAQRLDGGFAINEWLIQQGLLVLDEYPDKVTPFDEVKVNWSKTKAWGEGGYYARIFFNIQNREPQGTVPKSEYKAFQDDLEKRFETVAVGEGRRLESRVFKPHEIYRDSKNIAPDLIVYFGELLWRSIGSVGHKSVETGNDTGPDGCNHSQFGMFLLSSPQSPLTGEYEGARILDIAPTLLSLAGSEVPASMQGRNLLMSSPPRDSRQLSATSEESAIHNRLAGLGYI